MADKAKIRYHSRLRRHSRVRKKVSGTPARPRLAVYRSNRHISAQVIDDVAGHTLASASTVESEMVSSGGTSNIDAAKAVGAAVAERAKAQGITSVVFDRGGYQYHGRVAAVAEAAREAGLEL